MSLSNQPGSYGYSLNIILPSTLNFIVINSKRVERDFLLKSIQGTGQIINDNGNNATNKETFSFKLGTQLVDWFSDFVRSETILGDAALPHFLPGDGAFICKGDFIVMKTRNDSTIGSANFRQITLIFQGIHV